MILVTGATGNIGGATVLTLAAKGVAFRVFVRDPAKFVAPPDADIDIVTGDLNVPDDVDRALAGVGSALLVTANSDQQAAIERMFAERAAHAGVGHIVKVSSMEAAADATSPIPATHFESERFIKSLDLDWTMLQPNFFMQNLLLYASSIAAAGVFALPFGDAKTAMIDGRDVGACAAAALLDDAHRNRTYTLTGPELLDFHEVARRLSGALGKDVRYVDQAPDEFRAFLAQFIPSAWHVDALCSLFAQIAAGALEHRSPDAGQILGREPATLDQFLDDVLPAFR